MIKRIACTSLLILLNTNQINYIAAEELNREKDYRKYSGPFTLEYRKSRVKNELFVEYYFPYLEKIKNKSTLRGVRPSMSLFDGEKIPEVSFVVNNSSSKIVTATGITLSVKNSNKTQKTIPVFWDETYRDIAFSNVGDGRLSNVKISYNIGNLELCDGRDLPKIVDAIEGNVINEGRHYSVTVPEEYQQKIVVNPLTDLSRKNSSICAYGTLKYEDDNGGHNFPFATVVYLGPPLVGAAMPPSYTYNVKLEAGKDNYLVNVPISQKIPAGDADSFALRIVSDASARFNIDVSVLLSDGSHINMGSLNLDYFYTGGHTELESKYYRQITLPSNIKLPLSIDKIVENPYDPKDVRVYIKDEFNSRAFYERNGNNSINKVTKKIISLLKRTRSQARFCFYGGNDVCFASASFGP